MAGLEQGCTPLSASSGGPSPHWGTLERLAQCQEGFVTPVSCPQPRPPTGLAAPGLGRRPWVLLVSILEGFTVKIAPVGAGKCQKLVCYEAAAGTAPAPGCRDRGGCSSRAGTLQGHSGGHRVPVGIKAGPETPPGAAAGGSTLNLSMWRNICPRLFWGHCQASWELRLHVPVPGGLGMLLSLTLLSAHVCLLQKLKRNLPVLKIAIVPRVFSQFFLCSHNNPGAQTTILRITH